jgi:BlaI family transcriptional regulator, penicillinase repressor
MESEKILPSLSEAQTEIMNIVWEHGEVTLALLCASLAPERDLARNTVQTQLTRLVEKGWLQYRAEGKTFYYRATVPKEQAQVRVVERVLETVFGGSAAGLVLTLLDGRKLSKAEADRIRAMIEEAESTP